MLQRNLSESSNKPTAWQELAEGAPTVLAYAQLCSLAIISDDPEIELDKLSDEARTILALAAERGTIEIRVHRDPFDSVERFLAICVETEPEKRLLFLQKEDPQQTVRFLNAFRELCRLGFVLHHLQRDFSLSVRGFEMARQLKARDYANLIRFATEIS